MELLGITAFIDKKSEIIVLTTLNLIGFSVGNITLSLILFLIGKSTFDSQVSPELLNEMNLAT